MKPILLFLILLFPVMGVAQCFKFGPDKYNPWYWGASTKQVDDWVKVHYPALFRIPPVAIEEVLDNGTSKPFVCTRLSYGEKGSDSKKVWITFLFVGEELSHIWVNGKPINTGWYISTSPGCTKRIGENEYDDAWGKAHIISPPTQTSCLMTAYGKGLNKVLMIDAD